MLKQIIRWSTILSVLLMGGAGWLNTQDRVVVGQAIAQAASEPVSEKSTALTEVDHLGLPLIFVPNAGQNDPAIHFQAHPLGGTIFFTPAEVVLSLPGVGAQLPQPHDGAAIVRLRFEAANPMPEITAANRLPSLVNYFVGADAARWRANLPTYEGIVYQQLYDGIDLHYEGTSQALKGTYWVAPGADPNSIRWHYEGIERADIDPVSGDLILTLPGQGDSEPLTLVEKAPIAWQTIYNRRLPVEIHYTLTTETDQPRPDSSQSISLGFSLGSYNPAYPLIIDPYLVYSALIGGSGFDEGRDIAVDSAGNVYLTGTTLSTNFPSAAAPQNTYGGSNNNNFGDAFIAKLNPAGNALVYMTYLGGNGADIGDAISVDSLGNAYVTGLTESNNFPTTAGAYQQNRVAQNCTTPPCADAFVTKLNAAGNTLAFSTYLGGGGEENISMLDAGTRDNTTGIAIDGNSNVYVTGVTFSTNFPTQNQVFNDGDGAFSDIFLSKLSANGQSLLYSTYLGGNGAEYGGDVAVDNAGNAYLTGASLANDFPRRNALQNSVSTIPDAIVAKINTTQSGDASWVFSTYLGANGADYGFGIGLNPTTGNIYVAGYTTSLNLPTVNAYRATNTSAGDAIPQDAFLTVLNPAGSARLYSTYLGGSDNDVAYGMDLDPQGNVYLTGTTNSDDFPSRAPWQATRSDFRDTFVVKLNPSQNGDASLVYSTFFGSPLNDYSYGIAVDGQGDAYITGYGSGAADDEFPIHTTIGPNGSGNGILVAKFGPPPAAPADKFIYLPLIIANNEPDIPE